MEKRSVVLDDEEVQLASPARGGSKLEKRGLRNRPEVISSIYNNAAVHRHRNNASNNTSQSSLASSKKGAPKATRTVAKGASLQVRHLSE